MTFVVVKRKMAILFLVKYERTNLFSVKRNQYLFFCNEFFTILEQCHSSPLSLWMFLSSIESEGSVFFFCLFSCENEGLPQKCYLNWLAFGPRVWPPPGPEIYYR